MTKKKAKAENLPEAEVTENVDPFIGGEEDDLMDMEYVQDETTESHDTHPPETEEEAELIAQGKDKDVEDPTPLEAEEKDDAVQVEETEEVEAEAEETPVLEAEEETPEEQRIPKERFDEVNERMKRAEEKVKDLENQLETTIESKIEPEPEPEPYDYAAKDAEAMDALLEGDAKRYGEIQDEIRQATRDEAIREAKKLAAEGDLQVRETLTFEEAAAQIERNYPQFSEGTEEFNKAAYDELMDLYVGYAQSGRYTRVDAMRKAADNAVKIYGLNQVTDPEPEPAPDNVVNIKKTDVATKAKMAERQPPRMEAGTAGKEEPRVDVNSMSDEQYESLPESTKRRLRGDIL
jgi:hypothetical protein